MKNKIIFILIILLLSLLVFTNSSDADTILPDDYYLICLLPGETLIWGNNDTTTCPSFASSCKRCTHVINGKFWFTNPNICNSLALDCTYLSETQTEENIPLNVEINSPKDNQGTDNKYMYVDVLNSKRADLYYKSDNGSWTQVCNDCKHWREKKRFTEGQHLIEMKAIDPWNNIDFDQASFFYDAKAPKIKKTEPRKNEFTDGTFTVFYDEANLDMIELHIKQKNGTDSSGKPTYEEKTYVKDKTQCPSGRKVSCSFSIDDLQQGVLYYWFIVKDKVDQDESKKTKVTYDTVAPDLNVFSPVDDGIYFKSVLFNFTIEADDDYDIYYTDFRGRWKKLASNKAHIEKEIFCPFRDGGEFDLQIKVVDDAGNEVAESLHVIVTNI